MFFKIELKLLMFLVDNVLIGFVEMLLMWIFFFFKLVVKYFIFVLREVFVIFMML